MTYADGAAYELRNAHRPELVIALHGLTADHTQPLALLDGFSDEIGVLAPDLRAHGASRLTGDPSEFRPADLARDVVDLVGYLGLTPKEIRVFGISMGATVALELARSGSLPVTAAAYVRPAHGAEPPLQLAVNSVIAQLLREDPTTAGTRLLMTPEYQAVAAVSERHAASLRRKAADANPERQAMVLANGSWTAFLSDADAVPDIPTLVVAAEDDPLHPVETAREWVKRLPGARFTTVPSDIGDRAQAMRIRDLTRAFLMKPNGAAA